MVCVCVCVYQVISRTSELLESSSEQRKSCEATLEQRQRQITKLDTAFKSASQEVMKVSRLHIVWGCW